MINDYNLHKGGADKSDQLVLYYGYSHRSWKLWTRVFFHLLDLSIVNASILYNTVAEKSPTQLDFRLSLVASLLEGHKCPTDRRHVASTRVLPMRLSDQAFPEPIREETLSGGHPPFEVCWARRKKILTQFQYKVCKTPLSLCESSSQFILQYNEIPYLFTLRRQDYTSIL